MTYRFTDNGQAGMYAELWINRMGEHQMPDTKMKLLRTKGGKEWYEMKLNGFDWIRLSHWAELMIEEQFQNANTGNG